MLISTLVLQLGGGGVRASIPSLVMHAGPFSKAILILLVVLSVYSWAVIWNRLRLYTSIEKADKAFLTAFRALPPGADLTLATQQHAGSLLARLALAGQRTLDQHTVESVGTAARIDLAQRAMDRAAADEVTTLERHIGFLATTGTVSPFIGLLGTVWGVMAAFVNIGAQGSATLVVVAPGIAEALIATIAGLAAAIPAVIGYNHLLGRLRDFTQSAAQLTGEFLDRRLGSRKA